MARQQAGPDGGQVILSPSDDSQQQEARPLSVPEWTYDDFTEAAPYEWLYRFRGNAFVLSQMLAKANRQARAVRFTGFSKMWNAFLAAQKPQNATVVGENDTNFTDQPVQLRCRQYNCEDSGISYTNQMGQAVEVLSHPLLPVMRVINLDTNDEKLMLKFVRGTKEKEWRTVIENTETLASSQKIIGLARKGVAVNSENAKELVNYITRLVSCNYDEIPVQNSVSHLGWIKGRKDFVPYCDDVVYDGDNPEFVQMFDGFKETGDEEEWLRIAKEVRAGKSVPARIALAASFAAPLVSKLNGLPFFVHLWGAKGCGKSVGLMLAASVWGNPEIGRYIKTFGGTKVSQEIYASFCANVPIIFDELQIVADRRSFDDVIYMLCEGVSKGRGTKDGGLQRQRLWASTIITSAEMPIVQSNSGGGASVRVIEVNFGGQPFFEDSRAVAESLKENYGFAGRKFIEAIQNEEAFSEVRRIQKKYYDELRGDIQDKQVLSASILLAADKLVDTAIFHDGKSLRPNDIRPYLVTNEASDADARCYEWLCGVIASNPVRFEDSSDNMGELWGEVKQEGGREIVYFIKTCFDKTFINSGYSAGSFLAWARRKGLLKQIPTRPDKMTVQRRFGGRLTSCIGLYLPDEEKQTAGPAGMAVVQQDEDDDMPF